MGKRVIPTEAGYINIQGIKCVNVRFEDGKEIHTLQCKCGQLYDKGIIGAWQSGGCPKCANKRHLEQLANYKSNLTQRECEEWDRDARNVPTAKELTQRLFNNYVQNKKRHLEELDEIGGSRRPS